VLFQNKISKKELPMSTYLGKMVHPNTNESVTVYSGFNWPSLFLGVFWFLAKELWQWALISFMVAACTLGLSWPVWGFFANDLYIKGLFRRGFLPDASVRKYLEKEGLIAPQPELSPQDMLSAQTKE
jgi:hypothetical protein